MSSLIRADTRVFNAGLAPSRTQAQRLIAEGRVTCGGIKITRASQPVSDDCEISIAEGDNYVSRGAYKLIGALDSFSFDPAGLVCADIGASTGGFTQVLLERGAHKVYAVDVGHGQLSPVLRTDSRVISIEGMNARELSPEMIPEKVELLVYDVSFISASLLYEAMASVLDESGVIIGLIKPQFEAGRAAIGKNGIVKKAVFRRDSVLKCKTASEACGLFMTHLIRSPIEGGDGNIEYLCMLEKSGTSLSEKQIDEVTLNDREH